MRGYQVAGYQLLLSVPQRLIPRSTRPHHRPTQEGREQSGSFWVRWSETVIAVPSLSLTQHPAERLQLSQILDHPFMREQVGGAPSRQGSRGGQHVSSFTHFGICTQQLCCKIVL